MDNIRKLIDDINRLHDADAWHVKRGFRLSEASAMDASNHMLEEAVELQAEVIQQSSQHGPFMNPDWRHDDIIEEAADTLICYLHLMRRCCVSLDVVAGFASEKLAKVFTTDPAEVTAVKPGVTRKARR